MNVTTVVKWKIQRKDLVDPIFDLLSCCLLVIYSEWTRGWLLSERGIVKGGRFESVVELVLVLTKKKISIKRRERIVWLTKRRSEGEEEVLLWRTGGLTMMAFFKSLALLLFIGIVQGRANHGSSSSPFSFFPFHFPPRATSNWKRLKRKNWQKLHRFTQKSIYPHFKVSLTQCYVHSVQLKNPIKNHQSK